MTNEKCFYYQNGYCLKGVDVPCESEGCKAYHNGEEDMNNQITGNVDPYGQICAYACPTTEWKEKPFVLPEELQKGWNLPRIEAGNGYVVSGDMVVFYGVDTPEKRMKLIEAYEKLK